MRVAILNITSGDMSGGYRSYLENVIPRMISHPNISALLIAVPESRKLSCFGVGPTFVDWLQFRPSKNPFRNHSDAIHERIKEFTPDVVYLPTERNWNGLPVPTVTMLQNMEPLVCPYRDNPVIEKLKNWFRIKQAKAAVQQATRVIAVSEFVKEVLMRDWGVQGEKVGTVYHGNSMPQNSKGNKKPLVIPDDWNGKYLFTAGSIRPARGLEDILLALYELPKSEVAGLVIAGYTAPRMRRYRESLEALIQAEGTGVPIIWTDSLSSDEMSWCYQNCKAFVMTSRVESFGMIAVEAMSHGCVCISADNPCLPEVFGDAAIYYFPKDSHALGERIVEVLGLSEEERKCLRGRAQRRANQFSWKKCAEQTVAELARAAEEYGRTDRNQESHRNVF